MPTLCQLKEEMFNVHIIFSKEKNNWYKQIKLKLSKNKKEDKISGKVIKGKLKISQEFFIKILIENKNYC